jgi:hypothetical protein
MRNRNLRLILRRDASFIGSTIMVVMLIGVVTLAIAPAVIDLLH